MPRFFQPIVIASRLFEAAEGSCSKKPPVIFMHGLLHDKEVWKTIPQLLADVTSRKVYTYDARNHGESEHTMDCSFDNNLYDLFHFMDKMDIYESVLVGHNMGGMTAIRAALLQPNRIKSSFLVDMHVGNMPYELVSQYSVYVKTLALNIHYVPDDLPIPNLALVRYPPLHEELHYKEFLKRSVMTFRCLAIMDALRQYEASSTIPLVGEYTEPSYFLYGSLSKYFVRKNIDLIMYETLKHFPKATFETFPGHTSKLFASPRTFVTYIAGKIEDTLPDINKF